MQCGEIRELLSAYIDNVLDPNERNQVEKHISTCSACRQELADLQETIRLVCSLGEVLPPEGFREQLISKLRQEPVPIGRKLKNSFTRMAGVFSLNRKHIAAAVIIVGIGISIGLYQNLFLMPKGGGYVKMGSPPPEESNTYSLGDSKGEAIQTYKMKSADKFMADTSQNTALSEDQRSAAKAGSGVVENQKRLYRAQKIIKEANLRLEIDDYKSFGSKLPALTEQYGGYIENSSENLDPAVSANFVIRVPNSQFSGLVSAVEQMGKVKAKQVSGRDVTAEYTDTESRLRNLQVQEQRLLNLINKAANLGEVVTLENELSRIRGEIESLQGRLNVLDDTVVYSTIRLDVTQAVKNKVEPPKSVLGKAVDNFKKSCAGLINVFGNLVTFAGWALPWIMVTGAVGGTVVYYRIIKRRKKD